MAVVRTSSEREKANRRRREFAAEMRAKGFRRVVRWVPDTSNPEFIAEYKRQITVLAQRQSERGPIDYFPPEGELSDWV